MHQPREQYGGGDVWAAIAATQQRIAEVELKTAQALGQISSQISALQASMITAERLERMLANKVDRDEESTWRGWQGDRYREVRSWPGEMREQRNSGYQAEQTRSSQTQAIMSIITPFLSVALSLLAIKLF